MWPLGYCQEKGMLGTAGICGGSARVGGRDDSILTITPSSSKSTTKLLNCSNSQLEGYFSYLSESGFLVVFFFFFFFLSAIDQECLINAKIISFVLPVHHFLHDVFCKRE